MVEESQRGELLNQMRSASGGYELVISPLLLALIGFALDRWIGTTPLVTVLFAVIGLVGAVITLYYRYQHDMDEHEARAPWAKHS